MATDSGPGDQDNYQEFLYVTSVFPPLMGGGVVRAEQTCQLISEFNWKPTVLTVKTGTKDIEIDRRFATEGIEVVRAASLINESTVRSIPQGGNKARKLLLRFLRSMANRVLIPDRQVFWRLTAPRTATAQAKNHDWKLVLGSLMPISAAWTGQAIAKRLGIPFVLECRDLVREDAFLSRFSRCVRRKVESVLVENAARIIVVTEATKKWAVERYKYDPDRIAVIPNGFLADDRDVVRSTARKDNERFTLLHAGAFYLGRNPNATLQAVRNLIDNGALPEDKLRIILIGNTDISAVERFGLQKVVVPLPLMSHDSLLEWYAESDVLLLISDKARQSDGHDGGFMCKVFDYFMAERPLLCLIDKTWPFAEFLDESGVAQVADADDVGEIAEKIERMYNLWANGNLEYNPNNDLIERFNRRNLAASLAELLDGVIDDQDARKQE